MWYEEICNNPHLFLEKVKQFASKNKIEVELDLDNIPSKFKINNTNFIKNENLSENG